MHFPMMNAMLLVGGLVLFLVIGYAVAAIFEGRAERKALLAQSFRFRVRPRHGWALRCERGRRSSRQSLDQLRRFLYPRSRLHVMAKKAQRRFSPKLRQRVA